MWFVEGHTYDVSESLSAIFLKEGWAVEVGCMAEMAISARMDVLPAAESAKAEVPPAHKQEYSAKKRR